MDVFDKIIPFEISDHCKDQIKESLAFRYLKFPEDFIKCSYTNNNMVVLKKGESLGYFNADHSDFIINEHWSERMRILHGNPTPVCCGFKMVPSGVGIFKKPEVAWECSQCRKIIPADKN